MRVAKDLMGSAEWHDVEGGRETRLEPKEPMNASTKSYLERMSKTYYVFGGCGYIGKEIIPGSAPVCGLDGAQFKGSG